MNMDPRYVISFAALSIGVALIKWRKRLRDWDVRHGQADVDSFADAPLLKSYFAWWRDMSRDTSAQIYTMFGVAAVVVGILILLAALLGRPQPPHY